jgi:hypothetical protein
LLPTLSHLRVCLRLLFLPAVLTACVDMSAKESALAAGAAAPTSCSVTSCGPGLTCYDDKWCVAEQAAPEPVVVRIKPPADSGHLTEHFALQVGSDGEPVRLQLTQPAVVRGSVVRQGELAVGKQWLAGTLVATAQSEIAGMTLQYSTKCSAEAKQYVGSPSPQGFELRLQPGYTYQLSFWPEAEDKIPPFYSEQIVGGSRDDLKLELPAAQALIAVQGRLVGHGQPLAGLRVQLDDEHGRQVSTRAVTDADGHFALVAGPHAAEAWLRFAPKDDTEGLPKGKLITACDMTTAAKTGQLDLQDVDLGQVHAPSPMVVQVLGPDGQPEAGAVVRLQQQLTGAGLLPTMTGYTEVHGQTDAQGRFSASMPAGPALLLVRPAVTSSSGAAQLPIELSGAELDTPVLVHCPQRPRLTGILRDASGQPVRNADLVLWRESSATAALINQGSIGEVAVPGKTDADGQFAVAVDSGIWRIWLQPSANTSELARALAARVEVLDSDVELGPIQLPAPVVLAGQIVDAAGQDLPGAVVEVLSVQAAEAVVDAGSRKKTGNEAAAMGKATTTVVDYHLLGSTTTGPLGAFALLLTPTGQTSP